MSTVSHEPPRVPFVLLNLDPAPPPPPPPGPVRPYDTSERVSNWVYFIQVRHDGPIRIGTTVNLARCLTQAGLDNHEPVKLIGAMPLDKASLDDVHRRFAYLRMHGQWFRNDAKLQLFATTCGVPRLDDGLCVPERCAYCAGHSPESVGGIKDARARGYAFDDLGPHRRRMAKFDTHPGLLTQDAPPTWTDHEGVTRRTPRGGGALGNQAIREFVMQRDGRRCQWCKTAKSVCVDHVITWRVGGANHPDNLRVLCGSCNSVKAGITDVVRIYGPRETWRTE